MAPAPPPVGSAPAAPMASAPPPRMASPPGEHRFKESAVPERQRSIMAPAPKAKAPPALRQQGDLFEISLFVEDLKAAGMEVRNLLNQAGAANIKSESREGQELVTAEMDALKVKKFMEKLRGVGEIRDKLDSPQVSVTDPIAIQIKLQTGH